MSAIILLIIIWLGLPLFGEWFIRVTTKPLLKVSENVYGFWDMMQGKFDFFHPFQHPIPNYTTMPLSEALTYIDELAEDTSNEALCPRCGATPAEHIVYSPSGDKNWKCRDE